MLIMMHHMPMHEGLPRMCACFESDLQITSMTLRSLLQMAREYEDVKMIVHKVSALRERSRMHHREGTRTCEATPKCD
jgi:hypothetical protein